MSIYNDESEDEYDSHDKYDSYDDSNDPYEPSLNDECPLTKDDADVLPFGLFKARIHFTTSLVFPTQEAAQKHFVEHSKGTILSAMLAWHMDHGLADYGFIVASTNPDIENVTILNMDQICFV